MTHILIADDHEVVRSGLRLILEGREGWEVVAQASNGREAVALALETLPDVAILDFQLPLMNGVEATRQIRAQLPRTEILIFTMHDSDRLVADLLRAGARGYLLKSDAKDFLITAVESLAAHKLFFTPKVSEILLESYLTRGEYGEETLTPRERGIVQLIAEGQSNKEVARSLEISIKTVETHRAAAMRKVNVTSTAGLVRYAIRNKLVEA
jgi:DNA-binding NarL/FixJ family response regulator